MTNVFSDPEEAMAESGCLVTDTLKEGYRGAQPSTLFPRTAGGCHGTRDCCTGDTEGAVAGGPSGSLGVLPHVVPGRKELSQRTWAQLLLPSGQGATLREASAKMVIQEVLGLLF